MDPDRVRPTSRSRSARALVRLPVAQAPALPSEVVDAREFATRRANVRFAAGRPSEGDDLLRGSIATHALQPGLTLFTSQVRDLKDLVTCGEAGAGISVAILLAGCSDVAIGGRRVVLAVDPADASPRAAVVAVRGAQPFVRHWQRERFERKLVIHVAPSWLESNGLAGVWNGGVVAGSTPGDGPVTVRPWRPSPRAAALVERILGGRDGDDAHARLLATARSIEILGEALGVLAVPASAGAPMTLSPRTHARIARVRDFLAGDEGDGLALAEIARIAGLSVTTLQRGFRAAFGTTVTGFRRDLRLEQARLALARDGISVAEAARLAGYRSAANFATAYRRRFGSVPSREHQRV